MITLHLPRVKYSPESVTRFIVSCLRAEGVPMFKTKFAGRPFVVEGKPSVVAVCYGGGWGEPFSRVFVGVPPEELKLIKERVGEWRILLEKYLSKEELEKLMKVIQKEVEELKKKEIEEIL